MIVFMKYERMRKLGGITENQMVLLIRVRAASYIYCLFLERYVK